jgi:hypothetical protein
VATIGAEQEWALILRVHNPKDEQLVLDGDDANMPPNHRDVAGL